MKRVYCAPDLIDAQLVSDTLASAGIANHVFNVNAVGALGEVPFAQAQPEVWVADDTQADSAVALLRTARAPTAMERPCPRCGEAVPGNFLSCWNCGAALPPG